jgi:prepilin-type N-terminal cleavage/methylation domain-containing protein
MRKLGARGFTLIEIIIAIVIMAIFAPAIIVAITAPLAHTTWDNNQVIATMLVQERLEDIYAYKANVSLTYGYSYITAANFPTESPVSGFTGFNRTTTITEVAGSDLSTASASSGFKKIAVSVTYTGGAATCTTVLGDYP